MNLYLYLAGVYKTQGELELTEEYKQRATEVADYLKVQILSTDNKADTTELADNEPPKEGFDLSQYKESAEWQLAIDAYTNAVQTADVNVLMDALQMEFAELVPIIAATQLGVQVDMDEIIALYADFYQSELLLQKDELTDRFGEDYCYHKAHDRDCRRSSKSCMVFHQSCRCWRAWQCFCFCEHSDQ